MEGYIHLYCGDGKGKTTAAAGLALRCAGKGGKVVIVQLLKGRNAGELVMFRKLPQVFVVEGPERVKFTSQMTPKEREEYRGLYTALFRAAIREAREQEAAMLVLDEVIGAVNSEMVPLEELVEFLKTKPKSLEVVLTGRDPAPCLLELADYITEMKKLRHPFDQGIFARQGIEY